jgi:RNA polymerase sigma-70 factor (ECF subfamily)
MDGISDDELMVRVAAGERTAFDGLVDRHLPRCLRLAERVVGSRAEAEEVAQEFFLRVWTGAGRWRTSAEGGARFTTWLYRVVVNLCLDRRRRPGFVPLDSAGDPADPTDSALTALHKSRAAARVAGAVAALPERQRAALVLCFYEGLSDRAAAEILELTPGAVESLLVRARRRLRDELGDLCDELLEA